VMAATAAKSSPGSGRVARGGVDGGAVRRRVARAAVAEGSLAGGVSQMQRARLLGAAVPVVDELGWSAVTVADIAGRARVSRRTFYDLFANREECLLTVLDDAVERLECDLRSIPRTVSWVERVRTGLWMILSFLERDRVLARVCVVQSSCGSRRALNAREEILARLAHVLAEGSHQNTRAAQPPALTAEGLVGAAVAIVYKRLLNNERAPLSDLHGELMGMIVLPFLGAAAASRERKRPAPIVLVRGGTECPGRGSERQEDPLREVPMRLTYRTARALKAAGEHPGASNREIGEHADLHDQGQISRLLARLQRLGLLKNSGEGQPRGERNAWKLTRLGERVTEQLNLDNHTHHNGHPDGADARGGR
jgi:AcrR family transcriptional regulator/DNA-binding MarR family transcriptional regulator